MAIRLPVVLAQHAKRSAVYTDCEESWITSLLFEERLDATLVADLASIQLDSTDYLCLMGIKGDFVLVSWDDSSVVYRELVRLGFESFDIVPVDGSERIPSVQRFHNIKKIYLIGYQRGVSVSVPIGQLKGLLESKSTPVFQLQTAPKVQRSGNSLRLPVIPIAPVQASLPQTSVANTSVGQTTAVRHTTDKHSDTQPLTARIQQGEESSILDAAGFGDGKKPNRNELPETPAPSALSRQDNFAIEDDLDFPHIDSLVDELDRFDS